MPPQDKLHMMGWPNIDTKAVSEKELRKLTGEGIHLGCLAIAMGAVFLDGGADWWVKKQNAARASSEIVVQESAPKRRRRIGPVKSLT